MLSRLQVKNFVLIDSLEIDFPEGLVIITGQTGAGKSILLGALSLVMGSKADAGMLSDGAENCVVEAEFEAAGLEEGLLPILEENDIDWDGGHLILRRVVNRSGRSRAFVNDSPVPLQVLQNISSRLIDIHSQHQTLLLADRQFQLSILDHFAGNSQLLNDCAEAWRNLGRLRSELEELDRKIAAIERDRDYNEAQFRQLDAATLRSGELEELEQEQKRALEIFKNFPAPELGYTEITKKYDDAETVRVQLTKVKEGWPELKKKLQGQVYSFAKMQDLMKKAGAPYDPSMIGVTREMLKNMFPKVQLMRFRFNVLDLAKRGMFYDQLVESVFAPGAAWDLTKEMN